MNPEFENNQEQEDILGRIRITDEDREEYKLRTGVELNIDDREYGELEARKVIAVLDEASDPETWQKNLSMILSNYGRKDEDGAYDQNELLEKLLKIKYWDKE